ncbi:phage tail tape measure protein [Rubinisphaera italica]|uniref:Phage-related minor tail protein n=1 Tax=Rubinisphaera italica TaxID=2527969 RepID=A0A5C5XJ45_9PLAN|nr:phage tail tape measure protein [Rubinisphaera italica]TWT63197.1 Phage-related minor tail protein [Rubinisphaera italica]
MSARDTRAGGAYVEVYAKTTKAEQALTRVANRLKAFGAQTMTIGRNMVLGGSLAAAGLIPVITTLSTFEDQVSAVGAVSNASANDLEMLRAKAKQLGATTSFTATQVAQIMTELGRAGFTAGQVDKMTESVLALSRATGTEAAISAGIMASSIRQFGLGAEDAARVADVLTLAANSTFNTVEGLGESLKYAGPVAKSLGMSFEDTVALLGVLGNVGIQGSEAGTALRRLGVISAGSGEQLEKIFGVSNVDAANNLKPLIQILDEINEATKNMPVAERTEKMAAAFGLLGITSANVLSETAGGVTGLADKLNDVSGAAAKTAAAMDDNLGGKIRIMLSALEGSMIQLGESLTPVLEPFIQDLTTVLGKTSEWISKNEELNQSLLTVLGSVTALGGGLVVLGASVSAAGFVMKGLATAIGAVKVVLTSATVLMTGFGIALGAMALVGVIMLVSQLSDKFGALNKEMERGDELTKKLNDRTSKRQNETLAKAETFSDPKAKRGFLARELQMAKKELQGYEASVKGAQKEVDRLNASWLTLPGNKVLKVAEKELEDTQNRLDTTANYVDILQTKFNELGKKKTEADPTEMVVGPQIDPAMLDQRRDQRRDQKKNEQDSFVSQILDSVQTPEEKFEQFANDLYDALERGDISNEQYDRAYAMKRTEVLGDDGQKDLEQFADQVNRQADPLAEFQERMQQLTKAVDAGLVSQDAADKFKEEESTSLARTLGLEEASENASNKTNRAVELGSSEGLNAVLSAAFQPKSEQKNQQLLSQMVAGLLDGNVTLAQIKQTLQDGDGPETTNWGGTA